MKKALISTIEPRETGYRVAQVELAENIFEVNDNLFWVDCPDDTVADDRTWYDPKDNTCKQISLTLEEFKAQKQLRTTGTQEI